MLSIGDSNMQADLKYSEFKMLVVRRKLSSVPVTPSEYSFADDYETNVASAECYIDATGDIGTGLFTRTNPPTWEDFQTYATTNQVIGDLVKTTSSDYDFAEGNQVLSGGAQVNYWFDLRNGAVSTLPQYDNSLIHPLQEGYVFAYDCWVTPFKVYTFGLWVDGNNKINFKWLTDENLTMCDFIDGGQIGEPEIIPIDTNVYFNELTVEYVVLVVPQLVLYNEPTPSHFKILPAVMDGKIALNINWYYTTTQTNLLLGNPIACSNTYRNDDLIDGGVEQDDLLYEGILNKYYHETEEVSGEIEESSFTTKKALIRERTYLRSTFCNGIGEPVLSLINYGRINPSTGKLSDNFVSDFDGTIVAECTDATLDGLKSAFEEYGVDLPYTQFNMPNSEFPQNYIGSTYGTLYDPKDSEGTTVGTYIKDGFAGYNSSDLREVPAETFRPSYYTNADDLKPLDPDFTDRYMAIAKEVKDKALPLKWHDDDLIHIYDIWFEEPKKTTLTSGDYPTNQLTFMLTYNPHYLRDGTANFYYWTGCYSPYWIWFRKRGVDTGFATNASPEQYLEFQADNQYGFYYGQEIRDSSMTNMKVFPMVTNSQIAGLDDVDCFMYVYGCEIPQTNPLNNSDFYQLSLAFSPDTSVDLNYVNYDGQNAPWIKQKEFTFCIYNNYGSQEDKEIKDPIVKNGSGTIPSENPNENQGGGEKGHPPGTHDNRMIPTKKVPEKTTNILASGLISMYVIDNTNLNKLAGDLFDTNIFQRLENGVNKPLDCILRLCETSIAPYTESSNRQIKLGICNTNAFGQKVTKDTKTVDCGSTIIKRRNGDYTDCYERIQIYLPFIGFKDLDGNYLQNKKLHLEYKFNFLNGKCQAYLYVSDTEGKNLGNKVFYNVFTGDFITTSPIGTLSNVGLISALTATGVGLVTSNVTFGLANAVGTAVANYVPTATHTGDFGSNTAIMNRFLQPYLIRWGLQHTRPNYSGMLTGEFSCKRGKISDVHGFFRCKNFSFHAINSNKETRVNRHPSDITSEEVEKIKTLLNNGVWKN